MACISGDLGAVPDVEIDVPQSDSLAQRLSPSSRLRLHSRRRQERIASQPVNLTICASGLNERDDWDTRA